MSVPNYYVSPHLLCVSPPIMSVATYYVCPHLLYMSPHIMSAGAELGKAQIKLELGFT